MANVVDDGADVFLLFGVKDVVRKEVSELLHRHITVDAVNGEMTRTEIMNRLGIKSHPYFMNNYIKEAFDKEVIELTQPDSPNSPTQKYQLTEKGKHLKSD